MRRCISTATRRHLILLDDYTKAEFPFDLMDGVTHVRLIASYGERVIGILWHGDDIESAWSVSASIWNGQGLYEATGGKWGYPGLDIPPPPAMYQRRIEQLQEAIGAARDRLESFPDAPPEWSERDEAAIRRDEVQIARLTKKED